MKARENWKRKFPELIRQTGIFQYSLLVVAFFALLLIAGCADGMGRGVIGHLPPPLLRIGQIPTPTPVPLPPQTEPPPVYYPPTQRNVTIVIDAGHGGHDPGTRGAGYCPYPEKTLNLWIATELAKRLRQQGANVVMTRTGDWFVELGARANVGDTAGASLFVSIHIDASHNSGASGMTVYTSKHPASGSIQVAQQIANSLGAAGIECRGVRRANYKVLRESNRAAVLIECGFLSNFGDSRSLATPYHRARIADAIAQGIANYYGW